MKASVIMSVYNERLDWVQYAIDSVLRQTFKDFEFLIVLDNPKREDLKVYIEIMQAQDSRIKFFVNKKNVGLVKSLNFLLKQCQGEYIFRMDADDVCVLDRFSRQIEFMEKNNLDFCATALNLIDEDGNNFGKTPPIMNIGKKTIKRVIIDKFVMPHPTWCVKKHVYDKLGGYRDISHAEDYDFIVRALNDGEISIGVLNKYLLNYRGRISSVSSRNSYYQFIMFLILSRNFKKSASMSPEYIKTTMYEEYKNKYSKMYMINSGVLKKQYRAGKYKEVLKLIIKDPRLFYVLFILIKTDYWYVYGCKNDTLKD